MTQNTKLCFDYSTGQVCLGRAQCKFKRVMYHREFDRARKAPRMGTATQYVVWSPVSNPVKAVVAPKKLTNFNSPEYYRNVNAAIGQLIMQNFPWGVKERQRLAPTPLGQTTSWTTPDGMEPGIKDVPSYRYFKLPPGQYEYRFGPFTGKAAFEKYNQAYFVGITNPGTKWPMVMDHLTFRWENYTDPEGANGLEVLKKIQFAISRAFSSIITLTTVQ